MGGLVRKKFSAVRFPQTRLLFWSYVIYHFSYHINYHTFFFFLKVICNLKISWITVILAFECPSMLLHLLPLKYLLSSVDISFGQYPTCPLASRVSCPTCLHTSRTSYLTCSTGHQYNMQPLVIECYYSRFFIRDISLQDPLIYINLTTLIHQPVLIRKPALWRVC